MQSTLLRFTHANIDVVIERLTLEPLAGDLAVLLYRGAERPKSFAFNLEGKWQGARGTVATITLDAGGNATEQSRMLLRRRKDDSYDVIEGAIPLKLLDPSPKDLLGAGLAGDDLWLSAEGVIVELSTKKLLPLADEARIAALFRWHDGGWWWRLLPAWPRKLSSGNRSLSDALRKVLTHLAKNFELNNGALLFPNLELAELEPPPATVSEPVDTEPPPAKPRWQLFGEPTLENPWWSLELSGAIIRFSGPSPAAHGHGATRRLPGEGVVLDVRPAMLHCYREGLADDAKWRYVFVEDHRPSRRGAPDEELEPGTTAPRLPRLDLAFTASLEGDGEESIRRLSVAISTVNAGKEPPLQLVALPPGNDALAPEEFWFRETRGFVRLLPNARSSPSEDDGKPRWPTPRIPRETRDARLSAWLSHPNAGFLDLSLLADNTTRLEVHFTGTGAGNVGVSLRAFEPALRLVTGAHALIQPPPTLPAPRSAEQREPALPTAAGVEPARLPPRPDQPESGAPIFHPAVFLSRHLTAPAAEVPFQAALEVDNKSGLRLRWTALGEVQRWCDFSGNPLVAPVEWAANDPAANGALSALRGLAPVEYSEPKFLVVEPTAGALRFVEIDGVPRIANLFAGETVCLLRNKRDIFLELSLGASAAAASVPAAGVITLQRRHAVPHLDYHFRRSLPDEKPKHEVLPADFSWVRERLFPAREEIEVGDAIDGTAAFTAKLDLIREADAPVEKAGKGEEVVRVFELQLDGITAFRLIAAFSTASGEKAARRWTLVGADGKAMPMLGGCRIFPIRLDGKSLELEVAGVRESDDRTREPWPFAGPGSIVFALAPAPSAESATPIAMTATSRIILAGLDFLSGFASADEALRKTAAKRLLAVSSVDVSISADRLELRALEFWFKVDGELFSIRTAQKCSLNGQDIEPPTDGKGIVFAEGGFSFALQQSLPAALSLREDLLAPLPLRLFSGDIEIAAAPPADGIHELVRADDGSKDFLTTAKLNSPAIELARLTRVYLRLRRKVSGELNSAWAVLGGLIGWSANKVFGLTAPGGQSAPQVTLHIPETNPARPYLRINGVLEKNVEFTGTRGAKLNAKLNSKIVFWDGQLDLNWDAREKLTLDAPDTGALLNILLDATYNLPPGSDPKFLKWCSFLTVRVFADDFSFGGFFSLEPAPETPTAPEGRYVRRPDSRLRLWPAPLGAPKEDRSLTIQFHCRASSSVIAFDREDSQARAASVWKDFSLEESLRERFLGDSPGKFPGPTLESELAVAEATFILGGDPKDLSKNAETGRLVGNTLYSTTAGKSPVIFWLRCPVREVESEIVPPAAAAALWLWRSERIERTWALTTATAKLTMEELQALAAQVLRFSRWHRNAIFETPLGLPDASLVKWDLLDSPLLNRDYDLADFTDTNAPSGPPRFPRPDFAAMPLASDLSVEAAPAGAGVTGLDRAAKKMSAPADEGTAPFIDLAANFSTVSTVSAAGLRAFVTALSRSVPFERDDAGAEWFYRWPIKTWCRRNVDELFEMGVPLIARLLLLSLYTPRPGERVSFDLSSSSLTKDGAFSPGTMRSFGDRSPLGENAENIAFHPPALIPQTLPERLYRDHLQRWRLSWTRIHPRTVSPAQAAPFAVGFINPDVASRVAPDGKTFPLLVTGDLAQADLLEGAKIFAVFSPKTVPVAADSIFDLFITAPAADPNGAPRQSLLRGKKLGIPLATKDGAIFLERLILLSITRVDTAAPADWTLSIIKLEPGAPEVDATEPVTGDFAAGNPFSTIPGDLSFTLGDTPAAGLAPALIGVIRTSPGAERTAAFGVESSVLWMPELAGTAIEWRKHGSFDDLIPATPAPAYRFVILHADGSRQFIPSP